MPVSPEPEGPLSCINKNKYFNFTLKHNNNLYEGNIFQVVALGKGVIVEHPGSRGPLAC